MRRWALIIVGLTLLGGAALRDAADRWIDRTRLPVLLTSSSVEMRDRNGTLLRAFPVEDGVYRLSTPVDAVDPGYLRMLIRYEDKRFYDHRGVDPLAILRAGARAVMDGRFVSGASTLTMQVARLLEDSGTGAWHGKLRQMRLALALERRLDKHQILSLYLTHAPFGGNIEGVRAASQVWFGKSPRRLTAAQAALLIALPQSPELRRPDRHALRARAARDRVLRRLAEQGGLPPSDALAGLQSGVPSDMRAMPRLAPHLTDRRRAADPAASRQDLTIDARLQATMEHLVKSEAHRQGKRLSAALVVADHRTGDILASVGSPDYSAADAREGFVDMTTALRSPGSTLKPLIYGLTFDRGMAHPETLIHDGPVHFGRYAPQNFDGVFRGDIRMRDALQQSLNIPVVKLTKALGPARVMAALRRSGASPRIPGGRPGLAIALGGMGISLVDLVQLYAAIAQGGQGAQLRSVHGSQIMAPQRVLSDVAAWHVGHILGGLAPPPGAPRAALAYKTGTSYGHRDAWAIGFDGAHVIGVWMGRADGTPVPGAFGGDMAAPLLFEAFGRLKPEFTPLPPPPAATLLLGAADLPLPLRRFGGRGKLRDNARAPELTFPPDGAALATDDGRITLKLRGGTAPFAVLANGAPWAMDQRRREIDVPAPGAGYSTFLVVDAKGLSDRVTVRLDMTR